MFEWHLYWFEVWIKFGEEFVRLEKKWKWKIEEIYRRILVLRPLSRYWWINNGDDLFCSVALVLFSFPRHHCLLFLSAAPCCRSFFSLRSDPSIPSTAERDKRKKRRKDFSSSFLLSVWFQIIYLKNFET